MRKTLLPALLILAISFTGCTKKSEEHAHHESEEPTVSTDPNKPLYDSVMAVHDLVMPRMDEMFKLSESLKDKIAKTPSLPNDQKVMIQTAIDSLENANEGMMVWMRQFKPAEGSTDAAAARNYLNQEMVKVTKVKESMLSAIEKAKALQ